MSWEDVAQAVPYSVVRDAAVLCSLRTFRGGGSRLSVCIEPSVLSDLGWPVTQRVTLRVGRGPMAGKVMLVPDQHGRQLANTPRSDKRVVGLDVPEDLARWEAPRRPAEHAVERNGKAAGALVITLPWDLSGEPPVDDEASEAA